MAVGKLIPHLEKFVNGHDRSVDWAKTTESLIDDLDDMMSLSKICVTIWLFIAQAAAIICWVKVK